MANLKLSSNLFLGLQELQTWSNFLDTDGFRKFIRKNSAKYGLFYNPNFDFDFTNGKVEAGTNAGTIKINAIEAINKDGEFIVAPLVDNVAILNSPTQFYWIKIKHKFSSVEKGIVSIDSSGNLTGFDTEFTKKLRGQPDYPSTIRFVNSVNNTQEYQILSVLDDNNAVVQGFFTAENNLQYEVVGTFTPGVAVPNQDKFPFQYDSCEIEIIAGDTNPPVKLQDYEFYLARVRNNNGLMIIEDKRTEIWQNISSFDLTNIPQFSNKYAGVEAIKFNDGFTTKEENIVEVSWGLRSSNWTASNSLRQITIANGQGGRFKRDNIIDNFLNGDLNGWRIYFENGSYSKITESVIDAGAIKVTLDKLDPNQYTPQDQIFLCPDVEQVDLKFTNGTNELVERKFSFPVNTPIAKVSLVVASNTFYDYFVQLRYKNNNNYSGYFNLIDDELFAENSFDDFGVIKINPADWVIKQYTNSTITLESSINSYSKVITRVDKGDRFGVTFRNLSNSSPLINLVAGQSDFYQKINYTTAFILTTNHIINLSSVNAKDGNEFFIFMKGPFNDSSGQFTLQIRQDYVSAGNPGTLLFQLDSSSLAKGNIILFAVFDLKDGSGWSVERIDLTIQEPDIGEIVMFSGEISGRFDNTGKGLPTSARWSKWALCNGANGTPDLRGRFIVGLNPANIQYQMGVTGGSESVTLTEAQMPGHNHLLAADEFTENPLQSQFDFMARGRDNSGQQLNHGLARTNTSPSVGRTGSAGGGQAHENRPPYYALAFVMKIE